MAKEIDFQDVIFATISGCGIAYGNLSISGVSSMSGLMEAIKKYLGNKIGIAKIVLRNTTKGWTSRMSIMLGSKSTSHVQGQQLSLF